MHIPEKAYELIKKYEGFSSTPYICPGGKKTIGYGHVIQPYEEDDLTYLNEPQAYNLMKSDVEIFAIRMRKQIKVDINDNQFGALVSFVYNIGTGAFGKSTMLKKLNNEDYLLVPQEFLRWIYVKRKPLLGLLRRRVDELNLWMLPPYNVTMYN